MDLQNLLVCKPLLNICSQCFFFVLRYFITFKQSVSFIIGYLHLPSNPKTCKCPVATICTSHQRVSTLLPARPGIFTIPANSHDGFCEPPQLQPSLIYKDGSTNLTLVGSIFNFISQTSHSRTHTHTLVVYPPEHWSFSCIFCLIKYQMDSGMVSEMIGFLQYLAQC